MIKDMPTADEMLALLDSPAPRPAPCSTPSAIISRPRPANRFKARCAKCSAWVDAEAGYRLPKAADGSWPVEHVVCPDPAAALPVEAAVSPLAAPAAKVRSNQYRGSCSNCHKTVEEGAGTLEMNPSWTPESPKSIKKWLTFHAEGECPSGIVAGVPEGRYALEVDGTMKFYVVANGAVYAKASDDEHLITNADTVDAVLTSIRFDIETAARRYGIELGECGRCGRALTSDWRLKGMGPVCSQKAW